MKKVLILKNGIRMSLATAIFATFFTILIAGLGFLGEYITAKQAPKESKMILVIFICIIIFIWLMFFISIAFSSKIIISDEELQVKRFGKAIWSFKKDEILECIYNEMHWWMFFVPIASINAGTLQFKLKNNKISKHYCLLTKKQVFKIKTNFNYPFRSIQTIYEQ